MKNHSGIKDRKLDVVCRNVRQLPHIVSAEVFCKTKDVLVVLSRCRDHDDENVTIQSRIDDLSAIELGQTNLMTATAETQNRSVIRSQQILNRYSLKHPCRAHHNIRN